MSESNLIDWRIDVTRINGRQKSKSVERNGNGTVFWNDGLIDGIDETLMPDVPTWPLFLDSEMSSEGDDRPRSDLRIQRSALADVFLEEHSRVEVMKSVTNNFAC